LNQSEDKEAMDDEESSFHLEKIDLKKIKMDKQITEEAA
jgi:hypothetical protein